MRPCVFFVVENPFTERDLVRFGIDTLRNRFDLTVLDATGLVNPRFWERRKSTQANDPLIRTVETMADLDDLLCAEDPDAIILNLGIHRVRHRLYEYAQRRPAVTAEFQLGAIPGDEMIFPLRSKVRLLWSKPAVAIRGARARINRLRFGHDFPNLFFRGGNAAVSRSSLGGTRVVDAHSLDYETFRETATNKSGWNPTPKRPYVVYVDQNLGYHPDYEQSGTKSPITPERFYPTLNEFFAEVTRRTGLDVVVAPHPRSLAAQNGQLFWNAEISNAPTVDLIAGCEFVLAHYSTAISFAILHSKPILQIATIELLDSWENKFIKAYSKVLGTPPLNIDNFAQNPSVLALDPSVDQHVYDTYLRSFLTSAPHDHRRVWEIVADEIEAEISK